MSLHLSSDLDLPTEAVTQTFAILAKRGVGKSYSAMVMVEEMLKSNLQVVYVDPIGIAYGLRTSANGKNPGFPIIIAGGEHGDVPLESTNGEVIADLIVDNQLSMVIDLSLMRKGEQKRFMIDFAETLFHRNRTAMHLVLDEADEFAPQRAMGDEARLLGAIEDLVRRGRARGIGVTLITQRPAVLNKNVLTQIEVLVAMRLTSPQDRNAINEWVRYHADEDKSKEMILSLPSLPVGTAWFWSPGWLDIFKKVAIRKRETFDSSSTPEVGVKAIEEGKRAIVNIDYLREKLSETIQKAEENDPKKLKSRVKSLEEELQLRPIKVEVKEVIPEAFITAAHNLQVSLKQVVDEANNFWKIVEERSSAVYNNQHFIKVQKQVKAGIISDRAAAFSVAIDKGDPAGDKSVDQNGNEVKPLSLAARSILNVLAQYPSGRTKSQISILSGYSKKSSSFSNALSQLRILGFISPAGTEPITITEYGRIEAGDVSPIPKGKALISYWLSKLSKAEGAILSAVIDAYPLEVSYDTIASYTGYSRTSSSFSNALSKLRALDLISGYGNVKTSNIFFEEDT